MIAIKLLLYKKKRFWMPVLTISSLNQPRMKLVRIRTAKKISQVRQSPKHVLLRQLGRRKLEHEPSLKLKLVYKMIIPM